MKKIFIISLLFFCLCNLMAQVKMDNKLIFTSANFTERTITGLAVANDTSDLLNVGEVVTNRILFSDITGNDSLVLNIPILPSSLQEGMSFWVFAGNTTSDNAVVKLSQGVYYPLINVQESRDTNCIKQNEVELLVFNGNEFQEMFQGFKSCPSGYVDVNVEYCIQQDENPAANFWDAILNCEADGAKLCSWGEWYYACQKISLGLNNMTNNWEWSESANNHASAVLILGNGGCQVPGESNTQVVTTLNYRCCYRKK